MSASQPAPASAQQRRLSDGAITSERVSSSASPLSDIATPPPPDALDVEQQLLSEIASLQSLKRERGEEDVRVTALPPAAHASEIKREDDGAQDEVLQADSNNSNNNKKRKRGASPPWTFPTAESSRVKSADGRRVSARVQLNGTPVLSENEDGRARSSSQSVARSRPASPPWKKFQAEGPTSVVVDGKRKSGRVNKALDSTPKRVSPRSQKKQTDVYTVHKRPYVRRADKEKEQGDAAAEPLVRPTEDRTPSSAANRIAELQAKIDALKPDHSSTAMHEIRIRKRKQSVGHPQPESRSVSPESKRHGRSRSSIGSPETSRSMPKLRLRFNAPRHAVPPPHPNAQPPSPRRPPGLSLFQRIEELELQELQQPYTENERGPPDMAWFLQRAEKQAAEEGAIRRKLLEEAQPGGKLSREKLSIYQDVEQQAEPPKQYGHSDHLVGHVLHLRHLQIREKTHHRNLAKKVAHEALEFWKAKRGPTEEDLREQEDKMFRLIYRQVVFDVRAKWDMVGAHVQQQRLQQWEAEEDLKRQRRLQEKLEWSESMVARQRGEADSEMEVDEDSTGDLEGSDGDDDDEGEEEGEENMSDSASEDESESGPADEGGEMNAAELEAYLKQRTDDVDESETNQEDGEDGDDDEEEEDDEDEEEGDVSLAAMLGSPRDSGPDVDTSMNESQMLGEDDKEATGQEFPLDELEGQESAPGDINPPASALLRSHGSSATPMAENEDRPNLSSDESTDMDSEDYDSDEDMSSSDDEAEADGDDEEEEGEDDNQDSDDGRAKKPSLLGFYSKHDIKAFGLPTPTTSAEGDERDRHGDPGAEEGSAVQADADIVDTGVDDDAAAHHDELQSDAHDVEMQLAAEQAGPIESTSAPQTPASEMEEDSSSKNLVPNPTLLRGTLRSYQHAGLDWLASLYRNGTNGILADEMGLGKTIQTIALLAHLAEVHECWETHLIIVPTSVILNWVTEFQKFLPGFRVLGYYGSAEERAAKRRGWVNDPHHEHRDKRGYNAVITSYNVAMQDINAIRNVQWHYLVLDEAHNIRNFNSQRWQLLIRLKTRARLLLTGTPLQNSLTELWSLLTFLTAGDDDPAHGDLEEFLSHWKEPVKEIFDRGVQTLSNEAQKVIDQLHVSLRPFLLRRLKTEVEKDLPKKTESVVVCKLSKRQRQLYQDYMGLAETRRSLTHGNAVSAGKVLLSLRRVCNHPDLFDPRPIQTSFAMERSPLESFAIKETLVRRLLGEKEDSPAGLMIVANEQHRRYAATRSKALSASVALRKQVDAIEAEIVEQPDASTLAGCQALRKLRQRERRLEYLRSHIRTQENLHPPVYGSDLREMLTVHDGKLYKATTGPRLPIVKNLRAWPAFGRYPLSFGSTDHRSDWLLSQTSILQRSVPTTEFYAEKMQDTIVKFAFCTPGATAPILDFAIPQTTQLALRSSQSYPVESDYAHEARARMAIAFPDSRLLIYDSGKLQRLTYLLRELQSRGSRSLIFTQMTGTLNILEQFLNLLNLPYLRLDGSTPVERRQLYSAEFNRPDSKYQCMILSSRAGGVGLNLVGASSVIFYDLDWNPQMDRQCMDRAHRIGQVRDVEVYKMVSEKTVEENILRRANQKSLLDQTVIQEGNFTTDHQQPSRQRSLAKDDEEDDDDVAAAIDRFLGTGGNEKATTHALESVEDCEDVQAAQRARKEEQNQDDADFADRSSGRGAASIPPTPGMTPRPGGEDEDEDEEFAGRGAHLDKYMIRHMERLLKDVPFVPPPRPKTGLDRKSRDRERRARRKR